MNATMVAQIVGLAVELAYAGIEIKALIDEAQANGGKLSDETMQRIEDEVKQANAIWEGR